jgi:hypothetical protein
MISQILFVFFALLVVKFGRSFVAWILDLQNKLKWMKEVAGPESLPIIGCMHKIPKEPERMLGFLLDEMNKVLDKGETVMKLWVGPKLIVVPLDSEAIKVGF